MKNSQSATEVDTFVQSNSLESVASDLAMVRVLEDLIEVLISKSLITLSDLPLPAQKKLINRHSMRQAGAFESKNSELIKL